MPERIEVERLLRELYASRVRGDLEAVCACFTPDALFEIAGASQTSPLSMKTRGEEKYRSLLAIMVRTFKLRDQIIFSILIDGSKAAVHWRANVHSRITGTSVPTELVDLIEMREGRITSYIEFFAPR
ncbi:MAG: nuclear transport factor 2 family protein [Steroidobacteraceae bacterium]